MLLQSLVFLVVGYFVSVSLYIFVVRISNLPQGEIWDGGFKVAFQFVALAIVVLTLIVPVFQKEWDPGLRSFSMFTAVLLTGYTVCKASGYWDPDAPLKLMLIHVVDPLLRWLNTLQTRRLS